MCHGSSKGTQGRQCAAENAVTPRPHILISTNNQQHSRSSSLIEQLNTMSFECGTCQRLFPAGWRARDNHLRSTGHLAPEFECDTCFRCLNSERGRFQHMEALNHFAWGCGVCDETWPTDNRRTEHEQENHNVCGECVSGPLPTITTSRWYDNPQIDCAYHT